MIEGQRVLSPLAGEQSCLASDNPMCATISSLASRQRISPACNLLCAQSQCGYGRY